MEKEKKQGEKVQGRKEGGKRKKKEGGEKKRGRGMGLGGRGAWVLRRAGPHTNNAR